MDCHHKGLECNTELMACLNEAQAIEAIKQAEVCHAAAIKEVKVHYIAAIKDVEVHHVTMIKEAKVHCTTTACAL